MYRYVSVILILAALAPAQQPEPRAPGKLTVAAANNLKFAFEALVKEFHSRHPDVRVVLVYNASGNLFAQISNRAPYDAFFSADTDYPRKLAEAGHADERGAFVYAVGRLVVWARADSGIDVARDGMQTLLDPKVRKISIANPRHAPYGAAALEAMKTLDVYDAVRDKLVFAENVSQAAQFVESGAADVGLIAVSLALAPQLADKGASWEVPQTAYTPIEQAAIITRHAKDPATAAAFVQFVESDDGRSVLRRFGYRTPGGEVPVTQPAPDGAAEK